MNVINSLIINNKGGEVMESYFRLQGAGEPKEYRVNTPSKCKMVIAFSPSNISVYANINNKDYYQDVSTNTGYAGATITGIYDDHIKFSSNDWGYSVTVYYIC